MTASTAISLFFTVCLVLPSTNSPWVKLVPFALVFAVSLFQRSPGIDRSYDRRVIGKLVILFGIATLWLTPTALSGAELGPGIWLITTMVTLLLVFPAKKAIVDIESSLLLASTILAIAVVVIFLSDFVSAEFSAFAREQFNSANSGFLGQRSFGSLSLVMVHFRTSPILIVSLGLAANRFFKNPKFDIGELLTLLLFGFAILISASRGIMLFSFLTVFAVAVLNRSLKARLVLVGALLALLAVLPYLLESTNVFDTSETSNNIKIRHVLSYLDLVSQNPLGFLFGYGTASTYFSSGFALQVWQTEITLLDMLRYWGILGASLFVGAILLFPRRNVSLPAMVPYLFYFADSLTNPLIFNSTGMIVIVCYWVLMTRQEGTRRT